MRHESCDVDAGVHACLPCGRSACSRAAPSSATPLFVICSMSPRIVKSSCDQPVRTWVPILRLCSPVTYDDVARVGEHPRAVGVHARRHAADDRLDLIERRDDVRRRVGLEAERVVHRQREDRRLGQQPVADGRRPLDLADVIQLRRLDDVGDRIVDAGAQPVVRPVAAPLDAAVVVERELVVLASPGT